LPLRQAHLPSLVAGGGPTGQEGQEGRQEGERDANGSGHGEAGGFCAPLIPTNPSIKEYADALVALASSCPAEVSTHAARMFHTSHARTMWLFHVCACARVFVCARVCVCMCVRSSVWCMVSRWKHAGAVAAPGRQLPCSSALTTCMCMSLRVCVCLHECPLVHAHMASLHQCAPVCVHEHTPVHAPAAFVHPCTPVHS